MIQQTQKLSIREYVSIAIIMVGVKTSEDTPSLLYNHVQNALWMVPLISACVFFIPLYLLIKTMELYEGKNLFDVIQKLLGKYLGFFVCLLIFSLSSFAISIDTRTYANTIRTFYFATTPTLILYAVLMIICAYSAKKGMQHIGSVSYLVVFLAVFSLLVALLLSTRDSTIQGVFPIWGPGIVKILKESTHGLTIFADFFLFTLLIPFITTKKEFKKGTWFALFFVSIEISFALLIYVCMFDTSLESIAYPFHTAIGFISLGNYLPNIEIIFFVIWVIAAFVRFTAFLYISALMFGNLFNIKDFEYLIPSIATVYLLFGMIPEASINVGLELKPIIIYGLGPTFTVISIFLWVVALVKGEFKHAKNKNSI